MIISFIGIIIICLKFKVCLPKHTITGFVIFVYIICAFINTENNQFKKKKKSVFSRFAAKYRTRFFLVQQGVKNNLFSVFASEISWYGTSSSFGLSRGRIHFLVFSCLFKGRVSQYVTYSLEWDGYRVIFLRYATTTTTSNNNNINSTDLWKFQSFSILIFCWI